MTDLEQDLRTLLADRAARVSADAAAGERAVADRLRAGDAGLAGVVSLPDRSPRRTRWVVAAAAAAAAVVVGAVVLQGDDTTVESGPSTNPTTPSAPTVVLEVAPVIVSGPCGADPALSVASFERDLCYELGDRLPVNDLIAQASASASFSGTGTPIGGDPSSTTSTTATELFGVAIRFTDEGIEAVGAVTERCYARDVICPTGQLAFVLDGDVLSAPSILQPRFEDGTVILVGSFRQEEAEQLAAALDGRGPAPATTTSVPTGGDDPTVGLEDGSAKDVAERVALLVFGEDYVTMGAEDRDGATFVTMEGPGGSVVAEVVFDLGVDRHRVLSITSVALDQPGALGAVADGELTLELPVSGTLTISALDASLHVTGATVPTSVVAGEPHVVDVGPWLTEAAWVWLSITTPEGEVLQSFAKP